MSPDIMSDMSSDCSLEEEGEAAAFVRERIGVDVNNEWPLSALGWVQNMWCVGGVGKVWWPVGQCGRV